MHVQKVRTVGKLKLLLRLPAILLLIPNSELERRLRVRAFYMRHSASWISGVADKVHSLGILPYWLMVGPREWKRLWSLVKLLANLEVSVGFLVYLLSGISATAVTTQDLMVLISSREILRALVPSKDHAVRISRSYDIELVKKR